MASSPLLGLPRYPEVVSANWPLKHCDLGNTLLEWVPIQPAIGAMLDGCDVKDMTDEQVAEVKAMLYQRKVVVLKNQILRDEDIENLAVRLGWDGNRIDPFGKSISNAVQTIVRQEGQINRFGVRWHYDSAFLQQPPEITLIYGVETPALGCDTVFTNTELACSFLDQKLKERLSSYHVNDSYAMVYAQQKRVDPGRAMLSDPSVEHWLRGRTAPLLHTHSKTGKQVLRACEPYSTVVEFEAPQNKAAVYEIVDYVTSPEFGCRLHLEANTLVLNDNEGSLHKALNDSPAKRTIKRMNFNMA